MTVIKKGEMAYPRQRMRKGVAIITLAAVPPRVVAMATGLRTPSDNGVSRPYDSACTHNFTCVYI